MSILSSPIPLYQLPIITEYYSCHKCNEFKPKTEYYKNKKTCRSCITQQNIEYREIHRDEIKVKHSIKYYKIKALKTGKVCINCREKKPYTEFRCAEDGIRHSRYCNECTEKIKVLNKIKHNENARIQRKSTRLIPDYELNDTGMKIISYLSNNKTSFMAEIISQLGISEHKVSRQIKYMKTESYIKLTFGGRYKLIELTESGLKMVQA